MRPSHASACVTLAMILLRVSQAAVTVHPSSSLSPAGQPNAASTKCDASFASVFRCPVMRRPCRAPSAVLQRNASSAIWGQSTCAAGSKISILLDAIPVAEAVVGSDGSWRARLPPQAASWRRKLTLQAPPGLPPLKAVEGARVVANFGEVLLCSGQSNMGMPVAASDSNLAMPVEALSPTRFNPPMFIKNGSAELAAAGQYTDKIFLMHPSRLSTCGPVNAPSFQMGCEPPLAWQRVTPEPAPLGALALFSGLCWHTGKALFEKLGGAVPVGLIDVDVGGSSIELWLPPGFVNSTLPQACGLDFPQCEGSENITDSFYYKVHINHLRPYTIGAVIWDQGERDVRCILPATNHHERYPCLQHSLIESWRSQTIGFASNFTFAAVQLPGYFGDCNHNGESSYADCVPGVFNMRLAQDSLAGVPRAVAVPTYDLSCPYGVVNAACPFGTVHNMDKAAIGERIAKQLTRLLPSVDAGAAAATDFPRAVAAVSALDRSAGAPPDGAARHTVTVRLEGGRPPLVNAPTLNCVACCNSSSVGDLDVSPDGELTFVNATAVPTVVAGDPNEPMSIRFTVWLPRGTVPTHVRYTANQPFPQCALVDAQKLPVYPFRLAVQRESAPLP